MSTKTDFDPDVWGHVAKRISTTYKQATDQTGTDNNCHVTQNDGTALEFEIRSYFSFNTAPIPAVATITDVEFSFKFGVVAEPVDFDGLWQYSLYYDADRIGASISTDDWEFPDLGGTKSWPSTPSTWTEYTASLVTASVNRAGDTDLEVRCTGAFTDPPGPIQWEMAARREGSTHNSYLTVTYTVPRGLFNRWNWRLPALPGFSNVIAAVVLPSGDLKVMARFYPRPLEA